MTARRVRVLVVDDSAIARDIIERGLSRHLEIEVVGKAADAFSARDKIVLLAPDVVTLDVEMPKMDGIEFLKRLLPQYRMPVVVVSAVTSEGSLRALEALEAGAAAVVGKPQAGDKAGLETMLTDLADAVLEASKATMHAIPSRSSGRRRIVSKAGVLEGRIVVIGASTGGVAALNALVPTFPPDMPPTLVVQHMPKVFTRLFAEALGRNSRVRVKEAEHGDLLEPGLLVIGAGDFHLRIVKDGSRYRTKLDSAPKVSGHRPSVDVLFSSAAQEAGPRAVGFLMTGMGRDGAAGLLEMRRAGGRCIAQDEESSVVFGMPKEAWETGAAERLVPLEDAGEAILEILREPAREPTWRR